MTGSKGLGSIYCIYCKPTKRTYIGVTIDVDGRIRDHLQELRSGRKIDPATKEPNQWQRDFDEYGEGAFTAYVLEENVTWSSRPEREGYWISKYQSTDPKHGYNIRRERGSPAFQMASGRPPEPVEEEI